MNNGLNLSQAMIETARLNNRKSFDDADLPKKAVQSKVSVQEAPARFSCDTVIANPFLIPVADRQVAAAPDDLKYQLNMRLDAYDENGLDAETISMSHPFGIMGVICQDEPQLAKALFAARLNALKKDITTWWTGRDAALQNITNLETLLATGDLEAFLPELLKYEKRHSKVPFCQIVAAKFIDPKNNEETALFVPFKQNSAFLDAMAQTAAAYQMGMGLRTERGEDLCNLPALKTKQNRTASDLVKTMLVAEQDAVLNFLIAECHHDLTQVRAQVTDLTRPLTEAQRAVFEKSSKQLQTLYRLRDRADIEAFLADPANADLNTALQQGLADQYLNQLRTRIQTTELAGMTEAQLSDMETTLAALEFTISNFPQADAEKAKALAAMKNSVSINKRVIHLYRFLNEEKRLQPERRMFTLNQPSCQRLAEKLTKAGNDTETRLYQALESYIDNGVAFNQTGSHQHLTNMQQARFDIRRLQQDQVEAETIAVIQGRTQDVVLTSGNYKENIAALQAIHADRQKTVPIRPADDAIDGVYKLAKNYVWRDERTLPEILADLRQLKVLKDSGYSMGSEMLAMIKDVMDCDGTTLTDAAKRIAEPTAEVVAAWKKGESSIWKTMCLPGNTYRQLEAEARSVVASVLDIAEKNPAQFRAFFGDVSLVIDQLKGVVGAEGAGLLAQLQHAATAHSAASIFAGDVPNLDEVTPEMTKKMKRFKLLCDMAEYSLHGGVLMNFIKNVYTGYAGTVGGVLGGIVAGPIGAAIGYAAGSALTVGNATAQAAGTYAIRGSLNRMTGEQVRMLDKVVNYGPLFMTATSPYDLMAQSMRNFGKGDSIPTAVARSVLSPVVAPFNRMYQAIKGIHHGEAGAWVALGKEVATVCSAVALTAALGGAIYATGFVAILGSPALGAALAAITAGYGFFKLIENVRKVGGTVYSTVKQYHDSLFLANSPMVAKVREECAREAQLLVRMMAERDLFHSRIQEERMKELYNQFWRQWAAENPEQAEKVARAVADQLNEAEKVQARKDLAGQINNALTIVTRLEEAMNRAGDIVKSEEELANLRTELKGLGLDVSRIRHTGLAQALQLLREEQLSIVEGQCGTVTPGSDAEEIFATLTKHYREIRLGGHLVEFGSLTEEQEKEAEEAAREKVYAAAVAMATNNLEDRSKLVLAQGLSSAVESQLQAGTRLTREVMESPEIMSAAATALENEARTLKDALNDQATSYNTELGKNETLGKLSDSDRHGFLANTRFAFAPSMLMN